MKPLQFLTLGVISLLLASGCQRAIAPSSELQQQFFSSLKNSLPGEEQALRSVQYYNLAGQANLALNELNRLLAEYPNNVRLLNAAGACYDSLHNFAKAQEMYERALAQDADNILVKNNLAYSYFLSRDDVRAEKLFQEILARQPDNTLARNNLGLLWCRQGKEKEALQFWQKTDSEMQAREKLDQVLAYLGRSSESSSGNVRQDNSIGREYSAANQARLTETTRMPPEIVDPAASPKPGGGQSAPVPTSRKKSTPAGSFPAPPATIEEVGMIVQSPSYVTASVDLNSVSQTAPMAPKPLDSITPALAPGKKLKYSPVANLVEADLQLYDADPLANQYAQRRRPTAGMKKPKIINFLPQEPQENKSLLENYVIQGTTLQHRHASGRQEMVVY
jgi:tetratricopeptide (TPR) repeat protein